MPSKNATGELFSGTVPATEATAMTLPQPEGIPYAHGGRGRHRRGAGDVAGVTDP